MSKVQRLRLETGLTMILLHDGIPPGFGIGGHGNCAVLPALQDLEHLNVMHKPGLHLVRMSHPRNPNRSLTNRDSPVRVWFRRV